MQAAMPDPQTKGAPISREGAWHLGEFPSLPLKLWLLGSTQVVLPETALSYRLLLQAWAPWGLEQGFTCSCLVRARYPPEPAGSVPLLAPPRSAAATAHHETKVSSEVLPSHTMTL